MSAPLTAAFAGLGVEERVARRLERYVHVLLERNTAFNLTGAKDVASAVEHVRDSLRLLPYVREPLIDIGSGGGFPAVPLAIASGMRITCVESVLRKARFLEEISRLLDLRITVRASRAEDAARDGDLREAFASATARAVGSVPTVIELSVPFLAVGGLAVLQRGGLSPAERAAAMDAALVLGARVESEVTLAGGRDGEVTFAEGRDGEVTRVGATGRDVTRGGATVANAHEGEVAQAAIADARCLLLVRKTEATGQRFPRRAGIPAKRPLCWQGSDA